MNSEQELQRLLGLEKKKTARLALEQVKGELLKRHLRYENPLQSEAIDPIYEGKNAVLTSPTASGKTEAVLIPVLARVLSGKKDFLALYLAPTKALLNDIYARFNPSIKKLNLVAKIRHGDSPIPKGTKKVDILFTTPESLDVMMVQRSEFLNRVAIIIIDEIHQLFGTPRGSQVNFLIQRLEKLTERPIQRIALSATIGNQDILTKWLCPGKEPATKFAVPTKRKIIPEIQYILNPDELSNYLKLQDANKILIFVNSRRAADDIFLSLQGSVPHQVYVHYSSISRSQRNYVETQFKKVSKGICIATSTLELGIDIGSIEKALLYNPPFSVGSFLQRIGRAGRRSDNNHAIMIAGSQLDILRFLSLTELANEGYVENEIPGEPFSVLVQQIFSYICSKHNHRFHENEVLSFSSGYDWIGENDINTLLKALLSKNYLRYDSQWNNYLMGTKLEEAYNSGKINSNIKGESGGFRLYDKGHLLANLPLLSTRVRLGEVVLYAGRYWRFNSIDGNQINVEMTGSVDEPLRPLWGKISFLSDSILLSKGMRKVLNTIPEFLKNFDLDITSRRHLENLYQSIPKNVNPESIWYEQNSGKHIYYTFSGYIANLVLQLIFESEGINCILPRNAGSIAIISSSPLSFRNTPKEYDVFNEIIKENWRSFVDIIQQGPFANLVPKTLQKREVVAMTANNDILEELSNIKNRPITPASLNLIMIN